MIDFIKTEEDMYLGCNCDRAAIKQSLVRYVSARTKILNNIKKRSVIEGVSCSYCKAVITQEEVEEKLKALEDSQDSQIV